MNGEETNKILGYIFWAIVIIGFALWRSSSNNANNNKITSERQNCIQQVTGNSNYSAYLSPAYYCSTLSAKDLNTDYPLSSN